MYLNPATSSVANRQAIEKRIVLSLINELLACTFLIRVDDGGELHPLTSDQKTIIDQVMNTDEDTIFVFNDSRQVGWIKLVYGNDGWDVISDYTTNLETFIPKTITLAAKLEK